MCSTSGGLAGLAGYHGVVWPRRLPRWAPQFLGYSLSAVCLIWVLHNYDLRELLEAIRELDWKWVALAVLSDLVIYVVHGWRWKTLLGPVVRLGLWRTVQAIYIGLFANEVLPLRTGEVIRGYLLAHWNNIRISLTFASMAVERLMDGVWLLLAFLITASFVKGIPKDLVILVQVLGALLILAIMILYWIVHHKQDAHAAIAENRWASTLRHIVEGLHLMGDARTLSRTAAISLLYLAIQFLTVWALLMARGFDLSFWVAAAVVVIQRFGTVIPNAPGNLGLSQAMYIVALRLFDVEVAEAKTLSLIIFSFTTLPLLIGGAVATSLTGLNLGELRDRARKVTADVK